MWTNLSEDFAHDQTSLDPHAMKTIFFLDYLTRSTETMKAIHPNSGFGKREVNTIGKID